MSVVGKISLGMHYFKIATLLRERTFLSSILNNSEVWYKLTKGEVEELEILDRTLLKRILSVPDSTPTAALYLETGSIRIGTIIKARRANYLQYLLKLPQEEMLSKFFHCQWLKGNKHDWTEQIKSDLDDLGLPSDLGMIKSKPVLSWKNIVKKKTKDYEFKELIEIKETKNGSKLRNLKYEKLELQDYLKTLDVKLSKTVFRFRCRMSNFSGNYKGKGPPDSCPLCGTHSDLQELCFLCPVVQDKVKIKEDYENIHQSIISRSPACDLEKIEKLREKED